MSILSRWFAWRREVEAAKDDAHELRLFAMAAEARLRMIRRERDNAIMLAETLQARLRRIAEMETPRVTVTRQIAAIARGDVAPPKPGNDA